ncbi:MAG: hypothetical protein WBV83_09160 [Bradyrhizobium sp.]
MLDVLDVRLHDEIAGYDDSSRERDECGPTPTEDAGGEENPKADTQLMFERPLHPRLQAIPAPVGRTRSAAAIENEVGAHHQTVTALAYQLCNRRVDRRRAASGSNNSFALANSGSARILTHGHARAGPVQIHQDGIARK